MSEITFAPASIPARPRTGRTAMPNPFTAIFPSDEQAHTFSVPFAEDSTEVRRLVRQARQAAQAVDRSPQMQMVENEDQTETTITVWTVARITRKSKDEDGAEADSTEE